MRIFQNGKPNSASVIQGQLWEICTAASRLLLKGWFGPFTLLGSCEPDRVNPIGHDFLSSRILPLPEHFWDGGFIVRSVPGPA